jgi:CobQ-like glutamine amidotransferase family enzyme
LSDADNTNETTQSTVSILQLFPAELESSGERGNVVAFTTRLERAGHTVEVHRHEVGSGALPAADLVVVGNGPLSAVRAIYGDLMSHADELRALFDGGVPFFAVGAGLEVLGTAITLADGSTIDGVGLFPVTAVRGVPRQVGYIVIDAAEGRLVGFEDNASRWKLENGAAPLGTVVSGGGNGDGAEGIRWKSSIGTQTKGPILPLNPALTDAVLVSALARKGIGYVAGDGHAELDRLAGKSREVIEANVKSVFTTI